MTSPYALLLEAEAATLSDVQIAQVLTYTRETWAHSAHQMTASDVTWLHQALRN